MAEKAKLLKKIRRKRALFQASEPEMGVGFLDELPTNGDSDVYHFFIGNGGTRSGLSCDALMALLDGVDSLYMPESKDFGFASVKGERKAVNLLSHYNGLSVQETCKARNISHLLSPTLLQGPPLRLYLSLVDNIPASLVKFNDTPCVASPPGLILIPDFVSLSEERELLSYFTSPVSEQSSEQCHSSCPSSPHLLNNTPAGHLVEAVQDTHTTSTEEQTFPILPVTSTLKHRSVSHYGYEFLYGRNTVDPSLPLPGGLPHVCTPLLERMTSQGLLQGIPDQLTVNDYLPGAGIAV